MQVLTTDGSSSSRAFQWMIVDKECRVESFVLFVVLEAGSLTRQRIWKLGKLRPIIMAR